MPYQDVKADIPTSFKAESDQPQLVYEPEEKEYLGFLIHRLQIARDQREEDLIEFDDKPYLQQHVENAKAANSYNPPRKNREDVRIVTGTTQEKENSLLSALLNFNLEASIIPFDKNENALHELGEVIEDLVKKSRQVEQYESKRRLIYKEFLDQGTCFVEEVFCEEIFRDKKLKDKDFAFGGVKVKGIKWEEKLRKEYGYCETNLLSGTSVYLGNIREFFLNKQPYAFIRYEIPYDKAKMLYGDWDRWEYVPKKVSYILGDSQERVEFRDFSIQSIAQDMVEVIKYQDPVNNEFMLTLNGIMMLPVGFPLTAISPSGSFTFAKGDSEPISKFFAYSKSTPAKTKVDQESLDETLKMLLLKMKKSFLPPLANNTGRNLTRKILMPGEITDGINPNQLQEIGNNTGPTPSEFNMFSLMKKLIDEKSLDPVFTGDESQKQTATEAVQRKQQQMMKLGNTIIGIVELEKELVRLRVANFLANETNPIDQRYDRVRNQLVDVYRSYNIETNFKDTGRSGTHVVSFDPRAAQELSNRKGAKQIQQMEKKIKEKTGKDIRFTFLDPGAVKNLEGTFQFDVTPTEKTSSDLDRVLFTQNLAQAATLFGIQNINLEYAKERWAIKAKEDPDRFFKKGEQVQSPEMSQQGSQTQAQMMPKPPPMPSVNTLVQA